VIYLPFLKITFNIKEINDLKGTIFFVLPDFGGGVILKGKSWFP